MDEDRRDFLVKTAKVGGAIVLAGGLVGGRLVRQSFAREAIRRSMVETAAPILTEKQGNELDSLPSSACEEIREYFHGICLNVHGFVSEICSNSFAEGLRACQTEQQKHELLNVAFSQKIVTATEVLNRVDAIAKECGATLDHNWATCCKQLAESWSTTLSQRTSARYALDVSEMVEPLIRKNLQNACAGAYPVGQRPAIGETARSLGRTAIMLLPVIVAEPAVGFPVFVIAAIRPLWDYCLGQFGHGKDNYQMAISERLAVLGNRVGSEFEREFRIRIADLHHWQERSLSDIARRKAQEAVPLLI